MLALCFVGPNFWGGFVSRWVNDVRPRFHVWAEEALDGVREITGKMDDTTKQKIRDIMGKADVLTKTGADFEAILRHPDIMEIAGEDMAKLVEPIREIRGLTQKWFD